MSRHSQWRDKNVSSHWERQKELGRLQSLPTRLPVNWVIQVPRWNDADDQPIPYQVRWHFLGMIQECGRLGFLDGRMPIRNALRASDLDLPEARSALVQLDESCLIWLAEDRSECQIYDFGEYLPAAKDARPWIPTAVRDAVFERDGGKCVECGSVNDLTLDHIHPYSLGGPDTMDNLQALCRRCNSRKGARLKQG